MDTKHNILAIFLLISLLPISQAISFELISPTSANQDDNFSVSISSEDSDIPDTYDVKVFINKDTKEYSEIYSGEAWKSPHFYLISVFPNQKVFNVIAHMAGETKVCANLRQTGKTTYIQKCNSISIKSQSSNNSNSNSQNKPSSSNSNTDSTQISDSRQSLSSPPEQTPVQQTIQNNQPNIQPEIQDYSEKIILNPKNSDTQEPFISNKEKLRLWLVYSFSIFSLIIIILLALRRL